MIFTGVECGVWEREKKCRIEEQWKTRKKNVSWTFVSSPLKTFSKLTRRSLHNTWEKVFFGCEENENENWELFFHSAEMLLKLCWFARWPETNFCYNENIHFFWLFEELKLKLIFLGIFFFRLVSWNFWTFCKISSPHRVYIWMSKVFKFYEKNSRNFHLECIDF